MIYLNLAPFKYNKLINQPNSPIQKLDILELKDINGNPFFEVHGYLRPELKLGLTEKSKIYGDCDATGSDKYLHIATWKCISELLERWAISNWWREKISCTILRPHGDKSFGIIKLDIDPKHGHVVITYNEAKNKNNNFFYYGFSHGQDEEKAINKATVEMLRNKRAINLHKQVSLDGINDKRLIYFSSKLGFEHFSSKTRAQVESIELPPLIVDSEIVGEWSKFATTWRCLFPDTEYNWNDPTHFMF